MVSPSHSASSHPPCLHRYRSRRHGLPYNVAGTKPSLTGPWPTVSSRGYSRAPSELATSHSMGGRLCVPELGSASISLKNIPNGRRIRDALAPQSQPRTHGGSAHQAFSGPGGHNGESPSSSVCSTYTLWLPSQHNLVCWSEYNTRCGKFCTYGRPSAPPIMSSRNRDCATVDAMAHVGSCQRFTSTSRPLYCGMEGLLSFPWIQVVCVDCPPPGVSSAAITDPETGITAP